MVREVGVALDQGYEVDVVALRRQDEPAFEERDGVCIYRLPISHHHGAGLRAVVWEYVGFTMLASLRVARLDLRRRYKLAQVYNPPDFLIIAAAVPKLVGVGIILDIHDLASDTFVTRFDNWRGAKPLIARPRDGKVGQDLADAVLTFTIRTDGSYSRDISEQDHVVMNSLDE